jgi:isocitrate dehydrogenase kinase/phosphatase
MSLSYRIARAILNGFEANFAEFQNASLGAQERFEAADWPAVHEAMVDRMRRYQYRLVDVSEVVNSMARERLQEREFWQGIKTEYSELIQDHPNFEIAETFYNSLYAKIRGHHHIREDHTYLMSSSQSSLNWGQKKIVRSFKFEGEWQPLVQQILQRCGFNIPFENLTRDVDLIVSLVSKNLDVVISGEGKNIRLDVLKSLFYRNKAAYLVGRIVVDGMIYPFAVSMMNADSNGLYVDTALLDSEELSQVFSFTRSYFMVDAIVPSQYVEFLQTLMPHKERCEIYAGMGFYKHGKTEFVRMAIDYTKNLDEQYLAAPGIPGMVMLVFTMPSLEYVYKVIKDKFTPPKTVTHQDVKDRYKQVKRSDRVGRMADTQEFTDLVFDLRKFSAEFLAQLERECSSVVNIYGNALVLKHCYVERKMTPLNIYLSNANEEKTDVALKGYGDAIKELAAANIFPGDMLLKNFGVTRHQRVVFYDYDEICTMDQCTFREIPKPQTYEQEMASEPWYEVRDADIFPEEFGLFFSGNRAARIAFDRYHKDLYKAEYWRTLQHQVVSGVVNDVFPCPRKGIFSRGG